MTEAEVYESLASVFREVFDNDAITIGPNTTADDIDGWDSFTNISLMVAVENQFGIRLTTSEIESFRSVGDLVESIKSKTSRDVPRRS